MISFSVEKIPEFMTTLFSGTAFDEFSVNSITIKNGPSYVIEGRLSDGSYIPYSGVREICFSAVKGKQLPEYIKYVLTAPESLVSKLSGGSDAENVNSLGLCIVFRDGNLTVSTGASMKDPFAGREIGQLWDKEAESMLSAYGLQRL